MNLKNQPQITIDTRILKEIESSDIFYTLSHALKKYFRYYVPVDNESLIKWLENCDPNFKTYFKTFFSKYPSRLQYSPTQYQNWDKRVEDYTSVDEFDSLLSDLDGIMVKDIKSLEGYIQLAPNITDEGLYLSSESESFSSLFADVSAFSESNVNPEESFDDIWLQRFDGLLSQSTEIDIIDKFNFDNDGPDLGLFFNKVKENHLKYQKLNTINFIFRDTPIQKDSAVEFISSKDLDSRYNVNIIPLPNNEVSQYLHERHIIFYFKEDRSYGLALEIGLPANLYKQTIQRLTSVKLKELQSIDALIKERDLWTDRYTI